MPEPELLIRLVGRLDLAGIPYLITGSMASMLQGRPRSTHDIDVVIDLGPEEAEKLLVAFPPQDYYLDVDAARKCLARRKGFNVIDQRTLDKFDLWRLRDTPFDRERFAARQRIAFLGRHVMVARPEDTILAKLRWAKELGGSERQMLDVKGILEVQAERIDGAHLDRWAKLLEVEDLLARVRHAIEEDEKDDQDS